MSRRGRANRLGAAADTHAILSAAAASASPIPMPATATAADSVESDMKAREVSLDLDEKHSDGDSSPTATRGLSIRDLTAVVQVLPKWSPHTIFEVFMRRLEMQLKAFDIPPSEWFRVLVLLFGNDINAQEWVRTNVVDAELPWSEAKIVLAAHFEAADYKENLKHQYQLCRQSPSETVQAYGDRFRYLCDQLGYSDNNEVVINHFLQRLQPRLYADFLKFKSDMDMQHDGWSLLSLHDAVKLCIKLDVKNRTVQHAMSSSSSSTLPSHSSQQSATSWSSQSAGRSTTGYGRFAKRPKLFCKYHPHSSNHTTKECRNPMLRPMSVSSAAMQPARGKSHPSFRSNSAQSGMSNRPPLSAAFHHATSSASTSTARADVKCFACGGKGHYANDPSCPKRAASSISSRTSAGSHTVSNNVVSTTSSSTGSSGMNMNNSARPQAFRPSVRAISRASTPRQMPLSESQSGIAGDYGVEGLADFEAGAATPRISSITTKRTRSARRHSSQTAVSFPTRHD